MKTRTFITAGLAVHALTITTTRHLVFRRAWLWAGFLALAMIAFGPQPAQAAVTEAWVQRYGSEAGSADEPSKVVIDAAGNVIVAGSSGADMLIIKYSGAGVPLWTKRYNGPANGLDYATAVAVDGSGNVFVTGLEYSAASGGSYGYATIAYSGAGVTLWTNRYQGTGNGFDRATAVAVDGSGNVFVTGSSAGSGGDHDYATIAYSGAGVALWTNCYNGPGNDLDRATAVAVDGSGNVFVTGSSAGSGGNLDYATIAYSGAGVPLWTNRYYGGDAAAVAVDASGNVFVTGSSAGSGGESDFATIAYSGAGVALWTNRYNGPGNGWDHATAVAVDGSGNVFVTGSSTGSGGSYGYATIAYSGAGVALWTNRYNGPGNGWGQATAMAVDASGNVFVTGSSVGSGDSYDYATIAYSGAGVPLWTNRYNGLGNNGNNEYGANAVAVDASGNVFVTGNSVGSEGDSDYATIAYSGAGVALWTNRYGGRGEASDIANAVAVDASGNVFVTGYSYGIPGYEDYATIAYSGAGVPLWTNRYNGPDNGSDQATAVAVDASGNVFVTGNSGGDYATIAYSGAGVPLWTNRTGYGSYKAAAVAVDGNGNVFVMGNSGGYPNYATIAYSGAGVPLWTNRYKGPGYAVANAMAVDGSGNVFVTGYSYVSLSEGNDYATIAYSGAGVPLWTNRYDGPGNDQDFAYAVAVDASGNVFVTGYSADFGGNRDYATDYATIAYSGAGVPLWTNRYNANGYYEDAIAMAVDGSGNVFVTGNSSGSGGGNPDYATIAYSGAGVPLWTNRYGGASVAVDGSGNVFVTGNSATIAYSGAGVPLCTNHYNGPGLIQTKSSLAIGSDGAVYVTGTSGEDFATVKYVWQTEIAIQLLSTIPPKVNLTLSGAPKSSWAIERALELIGPWTNLNALVIGPNGSAQFQDTHSPHPAGFYRARQQ